MSKRVLLAEDELNIVESLSYLLERAGYEISVETDGRDALQTALSDTPDVLVLDVMLPGLDGYEILRQLRTDERTKDLPILMLTAKGQAEDRQTAFDLGADMFITKPFSNTDITDAVNALSTGRPA